MRFTSQKDVAAIHAYGDSDFAGDQVTRKSTSGGMACLGDHVLKSWSSSQSIIALSTGEAELYALNKACATAMGMRSLLLDLGVDLEIKVFTDATTGKAMAMRRGLGKVRHMRVAYMWIQEKAARREIILKRVPGPQNPADLMTKVLAESAVLDHLERLSFEYRDGRHHLAPRV